MKEEKEYLLRQLIAQILGELDYIETYCKKQREKLEEVISLLITTKMDTMFLREWLFQTKLRKENHYADLRGTVRPSY